jgi:2,3-dihydroxybiphenyl 1,2-dioxygenase
MLGLPRAVVNPDGSSGYRLDEASQRLIVTRGRADDIQALGLECSDDRTLDVLLERISAAGIAAQACGVELRSNRRVQRLHRLVDPAGNAVELYVGPEYADTPFRSATFPGGFKTGDAGMGHVVLNSSRPDALERFYVDVLGFGVTERLAMRTGPFDVKGTFLHCNRRHHSLALFELPIRKRLHHFMFEANELRAVGSAFERAKHLGVPFTLGLGQHPDPDGTFSFYGVTPSGFEFEVGAGGKTIDPAGWQTVRTDLASAWGHKPTLRLRLMLAGGLVSRRLSST